MVKVADVKPAGGWRLRVRFSDGSEGVHDFAGLVAEGGEMIEPLKDQEFFARVHVEYGVPTWPNGFDVDAIALHMDMEAAGEFGETAPAE
ncbi:MAG: DUF2442 domain-containing protein [Alphaproteobacteria bacterium]|nr:DUF2442 domain-containing protein [Alphaproteobacteria bacterium]MBV9694228.1 DUF2442 domain-containing protein [Alphaproteobacteria bacterium]